MIFGLGIAGGLILAWSFIKLRSSYYRAYGHNTNQPPWTIKFVACSPGIAWRLCFWSPLKDDISRVSFMWDWPEDTWGFKVIDFFLRHDWDAMREKNRLWNLEYNSRINNPNPESRH